MKLTINRCPHGTYAISVDDDGGGTRVTPSKCCGRWDVIKEWDLTDSMADEIIEQMHVAKEAAE